MKIAIIGYSGSGKSTLANFLGQHYNCEVLHLDKIHFTSNWQERTVDEMTAKLDAVIEAMEEAEVVEADKELHKIAWDMDRMQ